MLEGTLRKVGKGRVSGAQGMVRSAWMSRCRRQKFRQGVGALQGGRALTG